MELHSLSAQKNLTLNEALAGYEAEEGDVVKSQNGFAMYNGNLAGSVH